MSDRRLVVGEFDTLDPNNGKLFALDPSTAKGIAVPAFDVGSSRPKVGSTIGQGYYDTILKQGMIWTGSAWQSIVPNPILTYATEGDLLADTTASVGSYGTAGDTGSLFIKSATGWRHVGVKGYATAADLFADSPAVGSLGEVMDENSLWERTPAGWRLLVVREMTDTPSIIAWGKKDPGASKGDRALDTQHDILYVRTSKGWKPASIWEETEATIRAATWCVNGQQAIATDSGRTMAYVSGHWIQEPIAHFQTEALLLAAKLPNGTLAWSDDTNVVFTRAANTWHRLQGPQISVGITAPTAPGTGDLWYNPEKKLTQICTKTTPAIEWALAGGEADLKQGTVVVPTGTGVWFELVKGFRNVSGLYRVEIEPGDTNNGSIVVFELQALVNSGSKLRLVESSTTGDATIDMVGSDWRSSSHHLAARTSTRAGMAGWKLNVSVRALDGSDISGIEIGATDATEPGIKLEVPSFFPQLATGTAVGQVPVWNGTKWVAGSSADGGAPKLLGRRDLGFHHYTSDTWENIVDRWIKPGKLGAKVGNLVMVVMSVSVIKYHDGSVKLNSRVGTDASGSNPNQGWMEYNGAGTAHTNSGTIERTAIIKVESEDMKVMYAANSYGAGGGNGDRQGWGYIAMWDMGPEISVDL